MSTEHSDVLTVEVTDGIALVTVNRPEVRNAINATVLQALTRTLAELAEDEAIAAADTLLLTVPNQLGVDYNAHVIESVLTHVAPGLGWR